MTNPTQDSQSELREGVLSVLKSNSIYFDSQIDYEDLKNFAAPIITFIEPYVTTRVEEALQDVLNEYAKQYQKHLLDTGRSGKTPLTIFHKIINTRYKALTTTTNGKDNSNA